MPFPLSIRIVAIFFVSSGDTNFGVAFAARKSPTARPSAAASSSSVPMKSFTAVLKSRAT